MHSVTSLCIYFYTNLLTSNKSILCVRYFILAHKSSLFLLIYLRCFLFYYTSSASFSSHRTYDVTCKTLTMSEMFQIGDSAQVQQLSNYYHCYEKQAVKTPILKAPSGGSEQNNK